MSEPNELTVLKAAHARVAQLEDALHRIATMPGADDCGGSTWHCAQIAKAATGSTARQTSEAEKQHHEAIDVLNRAMHVMAERAESLSKENAELKARIAELTQLISDREGAQPCGTLETSTADDQLLA